MKRSRKLSVSPSKEDLTSSDDDEDFRYGWFGFTPNCLQFFNRAPWFVLAMFLANLVQNFVCNGVGVVLSTLERRFGFSSTYSSWIAGAYEIAALPMILLVSYVGSRAHRPRWVALGEITVCLGAILFILPHGLIEEYEPQGSADINDTFICSSINRTGICEQQNNKDVLNEDLRWYLIVFILARMVMGTGVEPIYTLGVTYLDDISSKADFSLYIVFCYIGAILGPAVAYMAGGFVLDFYTDFLNPDALERSGLSGPSDPRWVGAWWLSTLIGAGLLLLVALPFMGYPRDLPGMAAIREQKTSEVLQQDDRDSLADVPLTGEINMSCAEIPVYLKALFTNVTYVCMCIYAICDALLVSGFGAFGPKYVETQFNQQPSFAALLFGMVTIAGGVGGLIVGGGIIKRFDLTLKGILRIITVFTLLTITTLLMFFLRCPDTPFAGITTPYHDTNETALLAECNDACNCADVPYTPVCGRPGVLDLNFYSPCHAGCMLLDEVTSYHNGETVKHYHNCACINMHPVDDSLEDHAMAVEGSCTQEACIWMPIFLVSFLLAMFFMFACDGMVPSVVMRCVKTEHRTAGIGLQGMLIKLLGGFIGPVFFGVTFDRACIYKEETCGSEGRCLAYESSGIAYYMFILCVTIKVTSLVVASIAYYSYKPPAEEKSKEIEMTPAVNHIGSLPTVEFNPAGAQFANGSAAGEKMSLTDSLTSEDITFGAGIDNSALDIDRIMSEI